MKFNRVAKVKFERPPFSNDEFIEGLRVTFRVERITFDSYHKMQLKIYNLDLEKERWGQGFFANGDIVTLEAGYEGNSSVLFKGFVLNVFTEKEGVDVVTTVLAIDEFKMSNRMVNFNARGQVSLISVIHDIANNVGVAIAEIKILDSNIKGAVNFTKEFRIEMRILANTYNFVWFIYNSELYVYDESADASAGGLIEVGEASGMLESPVLTEIGINVKMLLEPSIKAYDFYTVDSKGVQDSRGFLDVSFRKIEKRGGVQRVLSVIHTGDTHGTQWYTEVTGINS